MFRIPKLRFAKFCIKYHISIPALYKCQNLPYSNEYGTEFLKPTAIHILCTVGFNFILLSVYLFFLTPPFTHSANFYCLQTVRHTRTVHVSGECMTYYSQLYHHSPKIMLQSQALRAQNLPYRLDLMEQILFSTAIQNCKFNQKCTSAHYIEPAHPLERLRSILIPEQPIIKNRFPVDIFQFNQNFAHIGK